MCLWLISANKSRSLSPFWNGSKCLTFTLREFIPQTLSPFLKEFPSLNHDLWHNGLTLTFLLAQSPRIVGAINFCNPLMVPSSTACEFPPFSVPTFSIYYHNIYTLTSDLPHAKINLVLIKNPHLFHISLGWEDIFVSIPNMPFQTNGYTRAWKQTCHLGWLRAHCLSHAFPIPPSFFCQLSLLVQSRFQPSITALTYQVVPLPMPSPTLSNPLYQNILNGQLFMIYFTTLFSDFLFSVNVLHCPLSLKINAPVLKLKQICGVNSAL